LGIERVFGDKVITTSVQAIATWARKNALWPMPFGTACCAIEMMATLSGRYDMARFGSEVIRFSPRQSDLMIVSGRISIKMMPVLLKIFEQMPEPKWVISMGACASSGGVFDTYTLVQGVDQFLPVHVYIPGCPPRPESLIDAVLKIQEILEGGPLARAPATSSAFAESPSPQGLSPDRPKAGCSQSIAPHAKDPLGG